MAKKVVDTQADVPGGGSRSGRPGQYDGEKNLPTRTKSKNSVREKVREDYSPYKGPGPGPKMPPI